MDIIVGDDTQPPNCSRLVSLPFISIAEHSKRLLKSPVVEIVKKGNQRLDRALHVHQSPISFMGPILISYV